MPRTTSSKVINAFKLILGNDIQVTPEFVHILKISGLKSAYRDLVKSAHPDKAVKLGTNQEELSNKFRNLTDAYELLVPYVKGVKPLDPVMEDIFNSKTAKKPAKAGKRYQAGKDFYYKGSVPEFPLRLAQFLYYRGYISWGMLIDAIYWQKKNRPMLGALAMKYKLLSFTGLIYILKNSRPDERLGETAVRLGLLREQQVKRLLGEQGLKGCKIGKYFTEHNILSQEELTDLILDNYKHNLRVKTKRQNKSRL